MWRKRLIDMTTLYQQIGEKFLAELEKSPDVSLEKLEALRPLFADSKKLKADDLVKIFSSEKEEEVK
jgi:hypothetical protein